MRKKSTKRAWDWKWTAFTSCVCVCVCVCVSVFVKLFTICLVFFFQDGKNEPAVYSWSVTQICSSSPSVSCGVGGGLWSWSCLPWYLGKGIIAEIQSAGSITESQLILVQPKPSGASLFSANDWMLLALSDCDLHCTWGRFGAKCYAGWWASVFQVWGHCAVMSLGVSHCPK